jgi:hypothetical protein
MSWIFINSATLVSMVKKLYLCRFTWFILTLSILTLTECYGSEQGQLGLGYSREFRKNSDISQVELFYRRPLEFAAGPGADWRYSTALEYGAAILYDDATNRVETSRLSLMGQVFLSVTDSFILFGGLGTGFMIGETMFTGQDLGGHLLFSSKLGFQWMFNDYWGAEYSFFHQSNGGLYDLNSSLNMHNISITCRF